MKKIYLDREQNTGLTIIVFAEGTILKPKSLLSLYRHNAYVPIGNAVNIISLWAQQGANIIYCTSRRKKKADAMANILKKYNFSGLCLVAREGKESYADVVAALLPNILIEDNCKSIGGAWQMCITKVNPKIKENIKSIIVPEFKGIDALADNIKRLIDTSAKPSLLGGE